MKKLLKIFLGDKKKLSSQEVEQPKVQKEVDVRGTTRRTKTGTSTVRQHKRKTLVNVSDISKKEGGVSGSITPISDILAKFETDLDKLPRDQDAREWTFTDTGINRPRYYDDKVSGLRFFYKEEPTVAEDGDSRREILRYELTKLFGIEGMIPPTRKFDPLFSNMDERDTRIGRGWGSIQVEAETFASKGLGLSDVKLGNDYHYDANYNFESVFNKTENFPDVAYSDYLFGDGDRHGANYFIGKLSKKSEDEPDKYMMVCHDNGNCLKEDLDHREVYLISDFEEYVKDRKWGLADHRPISKKFYDKILSVDPEEIDQIAESNNVWDMRDDIPSEPRNGLWYRINALRDYTKKKMSSLAKDHPQSGFESKEQWLTFLRDQSKLTVSDLGTILRKYH